MVTDHFRGQTDALRGVDFKVMLANRSRSNGNCDNQDRGIRKDMNNRNGSSLCTGFQATGCCSLPQKTPALTSNAANIWGHNNDEDAIISVAYRSFTQYGFFGCT